MQKNIGVAIIAGSLLLVHGAILAVCLGIAIDIVGSAGLAMAVVSIFVCRAQPSSSIGISNKWAVRNDEVWRVTHRNASALLLLEGVALMLTARFIVHSDAMLLPALVIALVMTVACNYLLSYLAWRHESAKP
jgi:uncharacterized membrane protein